ncbi:MAG: hypothetical protein SynsKO_33970 [Synoicihabitans sp.]
MISVRAIYCGALLALTTAAPSSGAEFSWDDYYETVTVPTPAGVDPQFGGLDITADGRLVACLHRGEVMIFDESSGKWELFASGLHEPLGIMVEPEGTILVVQRAELTRLHDTDGDGRADFYETVCNDWGMSGNYHEFAFGLVRDSSGNLYISLGTASHLGGVRAEVRGAWNDAGGLTHASFFPDDRFADWKEQRTVLKLPRMYARVPYRGCVLRITPGSRRAEVFATGFRTPNGLYMDADDQLWVTDNQGDWVGASKLHRVVPGGFHGHAASLLWGEDPPDVVPARIPVAELEAKRTRSAALFPQGDAANSMTEILPLTPSFGPVRKRSTAEDTLIVGEMNHSRIVRYLPDIVNGQPQGTGTHMLETLSTGMGNNRLRYGPDGRTLYLAKTHLSWPGREGIKRVTWSGKPYLLAEAVKLTPTGFEFTFNAAIEAPMAATEYAVESYRIAYHASYGSPKNELVTENVARVSVEGRVLKVGLAEAPRADRVYDIRLPSAITSELSLLSSTRYWYTAHEVYAP